MPFSKLVACAAALVHAVAVCGVAFVACATTDRPMVPHERAVVGSVFGACKQAYLAGGLARRSAEAFLLDLCGTEQAASAFARAASGDAEFVIDVWRIRYVALSDREESICSERFAIADASRDAEQGRTVAPASRQAGWTRRLDLEARLGRRPDLDRLSVNSVAIVVPAVFSEDDLGVALFGQGYPAAFRL